MANSVERVFAAVVEGQAQSLRFIQQQLSKLHAALLIARVELQEATIKESRQTTSEVEIQYALALGFVARCFSQSDFADALDKEYKLTRSENSPTNTCAYGLAYIEATNYNLIYSSVSAVAAAIAAGNCVILELSQTVSTTSAVLRKTLIGALDHDTFTIVDRPVDFTKFSHKCIHLSAGSNSGSSPANNVLSIPTTRPIAIVDREADMQKAASALIRARFAFGGQSPIAPHLVLVNEFRIKEFCKAIAEKTSQYFASQLESSGTFDLATAAKSRTQRISTHELDQAGAETVISASRGTIVRVNDRKSALLRKHINEPLLVIHPVKSIDDAIDFASETSKEKALAAIHIFGTVQTGKYVSQFVQNHLTCVNEIPVELIAAPLTPIGFATQLTTPYRKEMFSFLKPQYIDFGENNANLAALVDNNNEKAAVQLRKQVEAMNVTVKQPAGHAIGYFEQGILVGASVALATIVSGVTIFAIYGVPMVRGAWRR